MFTFNNRDDFENLEDLIKLHPLIKSYKRRSEESRDFWELTLVNNTISPFKIRSLDDLMQFTELMHGIQEVLNSPEHRFSHIFEPLEKLLNNI